MTQQAPKYSSYPDSNNTGGGYYSTPEPNVSFIPPESSQSSSAGTAVTEPATNSSPTVPVAPVPAEQSPSTGAAPAVGPLKRGRKNSRTQQKA